MHSFMLEKVVWELTVDSQVGLQLLWQGYGGMTTCDVMSKVRNLMRVENPPGYIVLHVEGNDLGYVKVGFLRNRIKKYHTYN